tara:strand:- start:14380 stop:16365 length:1986 start_codon:yes stop_codon:yes gene_type:complete
MFKKILIANRGEIACRIASTCKKMGIKTVGIYSDADKNSKHIKYMDECFHIGPAESFKSYLNIDKIIKIAKENKVDAVHPGYGFLSENFEFCSALTKLKIKFIGPSVEAIKFMGDKIVSKKIAKKAGVNIIPGTKGAIKDIKSAIEAANKIGFPVMIKASAGGGGKGMRVANNIDELKSGFQSAKNEARNSFGDDRVFVEKFIKGPRHIEIQILADDFGNMVYLGERECSVQRRHQKIIEECPSSLVDDEMRKKMGEQAILLAKAVNYSSAGTVEFVASNDKSFYFLEMNTRLQVEHPVTELVTGIDIVEKMINIASNKPLGLRQKDINLNGWSIEARIYAEEPIRNFAPSIGRVRKFMPPETDNKNIRLDSGIEEGGEISMYYDPMIAKLISHGKNREDACKKLSEALDSFVIKGVNTNISFVSSVICNNKFLSGNITTAFLEQEYPKGYNGKLKFKDKKFLICLAALSMEVLENKRNNNTEKSNFGKLAVILDKDVYEFDYDILSEVESSEHQIHIKYKNNNYDILLIWRYGFSLLKLLLGGDSFTMQVSKELTHYKIKHFGFDVLVKVIRMETIKLFKLIPEKNKIVSSKSLISPMPGRVVKICVSKGDDVSQEDDLIIIDAMKMENILKAEKDAKIIKINVKEGDTVFVDQELINFA